MKEVNQRRKHGGRGTMGGAGVCDNQQSEGKGTFVSSYCHKSGIKSEQCEEASSINGGNKPADGGSGCSSADNRAEMKTNKLTGTRSLGN